MLECHEAYPAEVDVSTIQSIDRAFDVLAALAGGPLRVTDVARRTGLAKSTAARLLAALANQGAVEQVNRGSLYRLGPRIATLAAGLAPARNLVPLAHPHLEDLARLTGEATGLSIPAEGCLVHYVDQVDTPHAVGVRDWTGTRLPMHAVSSGLVILAHRSARNVDRCLTMPRERFTQRTVIEPDAIRARLRDILRNGCAWTHEEYAEGITSVAAAVVGSDGTPVAAVHVHGPTYRFPAPGSAESIQAAVIATAARTSAALRQTAGGGRAGTVPKRRSRSRG